MCLGPGQSKHVLARGGPQKFLDERVVTLEIHLKCFSEVGKSVW